MSRPCVVVIVQASMGSTRLPGKVLMDSGGRPMVERQLERLTRAAVPDAIVTTTTDPRDQPIVDLATRLGVPVTHGSEDDVLDRCVLAAHANARDVVGRVMADCPLSDPDVLEHCVDALLADPTHENAGDALERTYPRGVNVEALTRAVLETTAREATDPADCKNVTRFIWLQPQRFHLGSITYAQDHSHLRWTIDTPEDLELVRRVYADLLPKDPHVACGTALAHANARPDLHASNAHAGQKA